MTLSLLVVTSQPSFGEHIRQSLEETTPAYVEIVDNVVAALYELERQKFDYAFLDTDIKSGSTLDLGLALRQKDPDLHLIIISTRQSMPRYEALQPWRFLHKPFFIPDLLRTLDANSRPPLSLSRVEMPIKTESTVKKEMETITWLEDVSKAAQHLTRLTLESSAQAALIIRNGEMWAYAGQLSDVAATELVKIVSRDKKTGDLLKFLRLNTTQAEHMLYATKLADETVLSMVFDAETPFSAIRRQATHLAESLAFSLREAPASLPKVAPPPPAEEPFPQDDDTKDLIELFDFNDEEGDGEDFPLISEILENIPNPNPLSAASEVKTSAPISTPSPALPQRAIVNEPMPNPFAKARSAVSASDISTSSREASPAIRASEYFDAHQQAQIDLNETRLHEAQPQPQQSLELDLDVTRVSKAVRPQTPVRRPNPEELIETRPHSITEVAGRVILEPASSGMYDLTYACLLVPRFSSHHLTGDLSDRISEWMPNICLAFGWRLEHLAVRPDYLQWVVNVPPTTSPGYLMRIMRKQTSERIFDDFPRQKKENPSGDFWAPGYLIMGGTQPHPSQLVEDYIKRTRKRQGI
ncbi:MAG: IS200/IS605 family transposase [Chloroflexi bacterium]|nr:MAG: IS200/IS605 family transposase [Chloroflexota bacterium]